jgi:phosphoglycerate kinase
VLAKDIKNKVVLLRTDYNVPIDYKKKVVTNDFRIQKSKKTIEFLKKYAKKIIIVTHLGRPKGWDEKFSLKVVAKKFSDSLNERVCFYGKNILEHDMKKELSELDEKIIMLENIRFYDEETKNDDTFSKYLASLCDVFVFDAFSVAHRKHASSFGICKYVPSFFGKLFESEVKLISNLSLSPKRPYVVLMGGAKISSKLTVIKKLITICDKILLGGGMIFTFYKAKGYEIGNSIYEKDMIDEAKELLEKYPDKLVLPKDVLVTDSIDSPKIVKNVDVKKIPKKYIGVDIGKDTIIEFSNIISSSKTLFWNGPMGIFETEDFANGSKCVGKVVQNVKNSVLGGGETIEMVNLFNLEIENLLTGGGASLEYLEKGTLPVFDAIK